MNKQEQPQQQKMIDVLIVMFNFDDKVGNVTKQFRLDEFSYRISEHGFLLIKAKGKHPFGIKGYDMVFEVVSLPLQVVDQLMVAPVAPVEVAQPVEDKANG